MADGTAVTFDDHDDGAFYLKPGQKATFSGLKDHQKYYVEEIGVKSDEYDDIKINDVTYTEYTESENEEGKKVKDIRTSQVVAENRRLVVFTNNCSAANKRELRITKAMQEGQTTEDKFSFKIYLTSTEGEFVPYVGPYYLYCLNDDGETIYYKNDNGTLKAWDSGKVEVAGDTDSAGEIVGIPVGYTISITQILSGTKFKVEEINLNSEKYKVPTITVSGCKDVDTSNNIATGTIELGKDKDASVLVTNRKNYKVIKAEKKWKDSKKSDGTGEENSDLEDDLKPASTFLGLYYRDAARSEQVKEVYATKQWACEFEIPGNRALSDYTVREVVKKGENNYSPVDSKDSKKYIKLGNYIYQVTYSDSEETETTEGVEEKTVSVVNTLQRGSIEITKNNANKEKLGGAEFKITGPDNYEETVTTPSEGENKGVITISDLLPGEYVITETKAPANYNLLANPITVVVGTTEGESTSSGFTVVGDSNTYYYDLKMEITNNKLFDMPAAGGGFRATIFGVGIMIIAGGWYIIRRRRRTV